MLVGGREFESVRLYLILSNIKERKIIWAMDIYNRVQLGPQRSQRQEISEAIKKQ